MALWMGLAACRGTPQDPAPPSIPAGTSSVPRNSSASPAVSAPAAAPLPPPSDVVSPPDHKTLAEELAKRLIILDGHIDVPYRLEKGRDQRGALTEDISARTAAGDFDYPRARAGGLDVVFMSIYVPPKYEQGGARKYAHGLIELVESFAKKWPDKFALARSPSEARKNAAAGTISLALGMENGSPIEHQLENVAHFQRLGVRYITLAHSKDNHIADSSYEGKHTHRGLSSFGKQMVGEMNRVGIMVDVAHISDAAFWQVIEITRAPVIASHSSCRHFTPGWERNMSDEMILALAKKGGVIQINFGSQFLDGSIQKERGRSKRRATVEQVADHIDHVVKLVGIDHVGLGSDFDGVGDSLPVGLKDVSEYPNLIKVLLDRGYSEASIEKICSGNVFRVWEAVEAYASRGSDGGMR
jgi:membrane dipeptidase